MLLVGRRVERRPALEEGLEIAVVIEPLGLLEDVGVEPGAVALDRALAGIG
jgi:hypothetical protein